MKRLVTERDVARLPAGARLELDADTLITPAARDLALVRGVKVIERQAERGGELAARGGGPGATHAGGNARARPGVGAPNSLPDGDYPVEVRDGQWRIRPIGKS